MSKYSNKREHFIDKKNKIRNGFSGSLIFPYSKTALYYFCDPYHSTSLYIEGSFPKIWYRDNVHLLYENQLEPVLKIIHRAFSRKFGEFPDYNDWVFQRLDTTYAWKFESEEKAIEFIEYIQTLELPRNSKHIYKNSESVTFGTKKSKTITFYRKYPEFLKKGFAEMKGNGFLNEAFDCLKLAEGVVRFEIVNRVEHLKQYFKDHYIIRHDLFKDKQAIPDILNLNLQRLKGDIDLKLTYDRAVYKSLLSKYKANKAMRLFCFYKTYFSNLKTRNLIHKFSNSGDIAINLKDLKGAEILIPTFLSSSKFDFSIPSSIVVNLPPSSEAVALELEKHLKLIDEMIIPLKNVPKQEFKETEINEKELPF